MTGQYAQIVNNIAGMTNKEAVGANNNQNQQENDTLFIISSTAFLSSTQLTAIANVVKRFYAPVIRITPNRRIAVSGDRTLSDQDIKDYLIKYGLTVISTDTENQEKIDESPIDADMYSTYTVTASKSVASDWTLKKLRGLAALIRLENLSGLYMLGQTEFLFSSRKPARYDALRHGLHELGFSLRL